MVIIQNPCYWHSAINYHSNFPHPYSHPRSYFHTFSSSANVNVNYLLYFGNIFFKRSSVSHYRILFLPPQNALPITHQPITHCLQNGFAQLPGCYLQPICEKLLIRSQSFFSFRFYSSFLFLLLGGDVWIVYFNSLR